jgi:hypothetical protein
MLMRCLPGCCLSELSAQTAGHFRYQIRHLDFLRHGSRVGHMTDMSSHPHGVYSALALGVGAHITGPGGVCAEGRTMSSTDALIQRKIDNEEKRVRRAIEDGGLPTEAEAKAVWSALTDVGEQLHALTGRIEGIAASDMGDDLPFEVSLEQIGAVAMLTHDVAAEVGTLLSLNERAESRISQLLAIRAEQQFKRGSDA